MGSNPTLSATFLPPMKPTIDQVREALRTHGIHADEVLFLDEGVTNWVFRAGDVVVRSSKEAEFEELHEIEALAAPYARRCGVDTPEFLGVDFSRKHIPTVFSIYRFADGFVLGEQDFDVPRFAGIIRELGEQAALLHAGEVYPDLGEAWFPDLDDTFHMLRERERLPEVEIDAIESWRDRLTIIASEYQPCLVHNDLHPWNVMVDRDRAIILDWANAAVGDPALDFAGMPLRVVPLMLQGYQAAGGDVPLFFEAAILHRWMGRALEELDATWPVKPWNRWPAGGLADVWLTLQSFGQPWAGLAPD